MGKRIQRSGVELEMHVNSICTRELLRLPTPEARKGVVEWLAARVVNANTPPVVPATPDPRQLELPETKGDFE